MAHIHLVQTYRRIYTWYKLSFHILSDMLYYKTALGNNISYKRKDNRNERTTIMYPTRQEAEELLKEAGKCNPGPWENHSRVAAQSAEKIARACGGMDADKAYVLGLLHDIGRKFGVRHLGHVYDGWKYMLRLGYDEAARICLTHSFNEGLLDNYIGNFDITEQETEEIRVALGQTVFDEYDKLIQLCDSLAGAEGVMDMRERMEDIRKRYGDYPQSKWDKNLELKAYFEKKAGADIYTIVGEIEVR